MTTLNNGTHPALETTAALATTIEALAFAAGVEAAETRAAAEQGNANLAAGTVAGLIEHLRRALDLAQAAALTCRLAQENFDGGAR